MRVHVSLCFIGLAVCDASFAWVLLLDRIDHFQNSASIFVDKNIQFQIFSLYHWRV